MRNQQNYNYTHFSESPSVREIDFILDQIIYSSPVGLGPLRGELSKQISYMPKLERSILNESLVENELSCEELKKIGISILEKNFIH